MSMERDFQHKTAKYNVQDIIALYPEYVKYMQLGYNNRTIMFNLIHKIFGYGYGEKERLSLESRLLAIGSVMLGGYDVIETKSIILRADYCLTQKGMSELIPKIITALYGDTSSELSFFLENNLM